MIILAFSVFLYQVAFAGFIPEKFEADFIQHKISKLHKKKSESPIKLEYEKPSRIKYHVLVEDDEIIIVCNPKTTWFYKPPFDKEFKGDVRIGKSAKYCYSKIFDSLGHGLKSNPIYSVNKITNEKYELTFSKGAAAQLSIGKMQLLFVAGKELKFINLKRLSLFYLGEEEPVHLTKKSIKPVKSFKKDHFVFKIPKNTNIEYLK